MASLKISAAEAEEVYKADCAIDNDESQDFDLKGDNLRTAKAYTLQGITKKKEERAPMALNLPQKEKKTDDEKINFITMLAEFLRDKVQELEITNPSQKIGFKMGNDSFSLTLTRHGKKKSGGK